MLAAPTFAEWSWLTVRSVVRENFVGAVLETRLLAFDHAAWRTVERLELTVFVAQSADTARTASRGRVGTWQRVAV